MNPSANINSPEEIAIPIAYLITFTCYGTWLHGAKEVSIDRTHNIIGTDYLPQKHEREMSSKSRMTEASYLLDEVRRNIVLDAIKKECAYRKWGLLAAHVRTNHVHIVLHANVAPEAVMNKIKAYASRALNEAGLESKETKRWTRHGSMRYLWTNESVEAAINYVVDDQGEPMAVFKDMNGLSVLEYNL